MAFDIDVAIIGAGPYGLSLAAHLNAQHISTRVFGFPMGFWLNHMPKGMHLKSDGFASNLYDPEGTYPLKRFCSDHSAPYDDTSLPVPLNTFVNYGISFQKRFVPNVQQNEVLDLKKQPEYFELLLNNDELIRARRVVVAVGVGSFRSIPACLGEFGVSFVTHSSDHHDLSTFSKRDVIVLGAGSSAIDIAALLYETGANVRLVARKQAVHIYDHEARRSLWQEIRHPRSGIGPGLRHRFYCEAPWLFHKLPEKMRLSIVRRTLGPAGGWFMKDRFVGKVPTLLGSAIESADTRADQIHLKLRQMDGSALETKADHVISATGFKIDIRKLNFLASSICSKILTVQNSPILSSSMESSVPGLYFTGPASANSFGPVMRFAFGARFATPHLARAIIRSLSSKSFKIA